MYSQQIKTFVIVAELGSFGKAAEKLGVNPAAVMKQMNALEDRLRLWLLRRCNHGVELTDPGRIIYDVAKKMIGDADSAVLRARAMGAADWHTVRVGSSFLNPARVLVDLWNGWGVDGWRIKIVPYSDDRDKILSVVQSLGKDIDFMVGVFNSAQMRSIASHLQLGTYPLCIAAPRNHRLAKKKRLSVEDLNGERLVMVRAGDSIGLDEFRAKLATTNTELAIDDTHFFYDMDTFNDCEATGSLLLTLSCWSDVHPSLVTLGVDWDYSVPFGILYSPTISGAAADFLTEVKKRAQRSRLD